MKFDINHRFTGESLFTADIDCDENASLSTKRGLAVRWALKNKVSLTHANLLGANLLCAYLHGADLRYADFRGADLRYACLMGANLMGANLQGADLRYADFRGADLRDADFHGADLRDADFRGADLRDATGLNDYIKCIQIDTYSIVYTSEVIQIGCENHTIEEWRGYSDRRILEMDGKTALNFWRKNKDWLFQTIELFPAKPTQESEQ